MRGATVATSNAQRVLEYGRRRGGRAPVLSVDARDAPRLPGREMFALWAALGRSLASADVPIAIADGFALEDLELLGFCVLTAPTAKHGLETFVRYGALLADVRRWEISTTGARLAIGFASSAERSLGVRLSHETALAQLVRGARQLCGAPVDPLAVTFRHAAPADVRAHRAHFRCDVTFGADADRVIFPRASFDVAPRGANRALYTFLSAQAEASLRTVQPAQSGGGGGEGRPSALVREAIAGRLDEGVVPEIRTVASILGTSERSLRRALSREGASFRVLVDDARRDRARALLARGGTTITRAALELGFADASAFTHACRRWFGHPPRDVRGASSGVPS